MVNCGTEAISSAGGMTVSQGPTGPECRSAIRPGAGRGSGALTRTV